MSPTQGFLWNLILAVFWSLATAEVTLGSLTLGFIVGFGTMFVARRAIGAESYPRKVWSIVRLLTYFLRELLAANVKLAYDILTPTHHMRPAVVAIPLDARTDGEITLLANLITLTPGTLALHVSEDRRVLYIHSMYTADADGLRRSIKDGLEKLVLEVTR